jgi:hypothetical protein
MRRFMISPCACSETSIGFTLRKLNRKGWRAYSSYALFRRLRQNYALKKIAAHAGWMRPAGQMNRLR